MNDTMPQGDVRPSFNAPQYAPPVLSYDTQVERLRFLAAKISKDEALLALCGPLLLRAIADLLTQSATSIEYLSKEHWQ